MNDATPRHAARVFSGVQPTGDLHLGNYLGAVREFVRLQESHDCIYCVVDLHALTVWQSPDGLRRGVRDLTAAFLACGLDPSRSVLFNQSAVRAHAELGWIFNCVGRIGWLNRMTQFKDKAGKNRENASVGLYAYPLLQAADILAYKATHVPIGEDQKQHLELCRDVAQKFNNDYGAPDFFPLPDPLIRPEAARVMSLRDGSKKMSKSDPSDQSRINLIDTAEALAQKIRKAKTDPEPLPSEAAGLEERLEAANLVGIFAALKGVTRDAVLAEYGGRPFSAFKPDLADLAVSVLGPIGAEIRRYNQDPGYIDAVLADGAARAAAVADPVLAEVYRVVGLR